VLPETVLDRQVASQPAVPLLRVLEGQGIGPLPAERLDESFRLAVGSGRVRPSADVPQPQNAAGLGKSLGDVGGAFVAHHPAALVAVGFRVAVALTVEPGDRRRERADHCWLLLISQHLDVRQAGGVVDSDMDLVVADPVGAPLLAIPGDPVAHRLEPRRGLDVDMDQVAWPLPLVPLHRRPGLQGPQSPEAQTPEGPSHGGEGWPAAAQRCAGGAAAGGAGPRPAGVAADLASAAGCGARSVDPPVPLDRPGGTGSASGRRS